MLSCELGGVQPPWMGYTNVTILSIILNILFIFLIIFTILSNFLIILNSIQSWHFDNLCDLGFDLISYVSVAQLVARGG